jgi:hypothetical protein
MTFCRVEPVKLPEVGDLVYVQLADGRRIPMITTASETDGEAWRFKALADPEFSAGDAAE